VEKTKKILIFSTAYYPFVGGAEVAIKEITDRMSAQAGISGIQFDLITAKMRRDLPSVEKIGNVNVFRIGFGIPIFDKILLPFWGAFFTTCLNAKNHYNYYWCMMVTFASGAGYIANIFSVKKIPIVLTLQEGDSEKYLKTKWFGLIDLSWRLALKRSSVVTVISNYLGERSKRLGYKNEPILIPNGVDVSKFKIENLKLKILDVCTASGLVESNGEAKKLIQSGSLFCNEVKVEDPQMIVKKDDFVNGILLLRKGKKVFKVVKGK